MAVMSSKNIAGKGGLDDVSCKFRLDNMFVCVAVWYILLSLLGVPLFTVM